MESATPSFEEDAETLPSFLDSPPLESAPVGTGQTNPFSREGNPFSRQSRSGPQGAPVAREKLGGAACTGSTPVAAQYVIDRYVRFEDNVGTTVCLRGVPKAWEDGDLARCLAESGSPEFVDGNNGRRFRQTLCLSVFAKSTIIHDNSLKYAGNLLEYVRRHVELFRARSKQKAVFFYLPHQMWQRPISKKLADSLQSGSRLREKLDKNKNKGVAFVHFENDDDALAFSKGCNALHGDWSVHRAARDGRAGGRNFIALLYN